VVEVRGAQRALTQRPGSGQLGGNSVALTHAVVSGDPVVVELKPA